MLFLFGKGKKYVKKEGGKSETRHCPHCQQKTTFHEVVSAEYIHLFFVPIYTDTAESNGTQPLFQCSKCESTYAVTGYGITLNGVLGFFKRVFSFFIGFLSYLVILFKESDLMKKWKAKRKEQHIQNELNKLKKRVKNDI